MPVPPEEIFNIESVARNLKKKIVFTEKIKKQKNIKLLFVNLFETTVNMYG
jgi:hypothetical protein